MTATPVQTFERNGKASQVLDLLPQIRRIRSNELEALKAAAAEDNHRVVAPTHVIWKNGQIVGYLSVGAIMLVNGWVKTGEVKPRESAYVINMAENIACEKGASAIALPCAEESPFHAYMEKLGYARLGRADYNVKVLNQEK